MDANEDSVAVLANGAAYLLETNASGIALGYYYHRRSIQGA